MNVFLSYSAPDWDLAREVEATLRHEGFQVWIDEQIQPGQSVSEAISRGLKDADAFVLLFTDSSARSQWTRLEAAAAIASGRPVIPLVAGSDVDIPLILRDRAYLDLSDPATRGDALRRLADVLRAPATAMETNGGLGVLRLASAGLNVEREVHEASVLSRLEVARRWELMAAVVAVLATGAGLVVAVSDTAALGAAVSAIAALIGAAVGFYFGAESERGRE
jgi:hypothetical protein